MKKYLMSDVDARVGSNMDKLRKLPEFIGVYITEAASSGVVAVVQLQPMTELAKQKVQQILSDIPIQFRETGAAEAY